jgi:hypothetical protein
MAQYEGAENCIMRRAPQTSAYEDNQIKEDVMGAACSVQKCDDRWLENCGLQSMKGRDHLKT